MDHLSKIQARNIIESVGSSGLPPEYGFKYFTVGLEPYVNAIENEYLSSFINEGGSSFKLVKGVYGGGKTHFLYCIRDLAWKYNFAVSYVVLSPESTPFHKLELVYKEIINSVTLPLDDEEIISGYEKGIAACLQKYFMKLKADIPDDVEDEVSINEIITSNIDSLQLSKSISFSKAIKAALHSLLKNDDESFDMICQWLNGEGYIRNIHSKFGILEKIDKTTAFKMIRSLAQMLRFMGHNGLVILFDEAEQKSSMSTKQRGALQSNLRELIDACGHTNFQGIMIFYAVPDLSFLEGTTQVYEALKQRLATHFDELNPMGVQVDLENSVKEPNIFLEGVGKKLSDIYQAAFDCEFEDSKINSTIKKIAEYAYSERFGDIGYKRLFVKTAIRGFNYLKAHNAIPDDSDIAPGE